MDKSRNEKMLPVDSGRRVKCLYRPDQGTARAWQQERHLPRPGSAWPSWLWTTQGFKAIQDLRVSALLSTPILLEADFPSPFMILCTCDVHPSLSSRAGWSCSSSSPSPQAMGNSPNRNHSGGRSTALDSLTQWRSYLHHLSRLC